LPPFLTAAGVARDFVAGRLRRWDRSHQADDGVLIISEMSSNALIHAPSPEYVVAIDWNGGWVRLEIWDSSPRRPRLLPIDFEKEHGRGMHLIAALSEAWGSRVTASGKRVRAILPRVSQDS
jgi:anti-sigma regulatory factor (Ser/Thr protein kinase)